MSDVGVTTCDECHGVIPSDQQRVRLAGATLSTGSGTQNLGALDFCSSAHLLQYLGALVNVPTPHPPYPPLPAH